MQARELTMTGWSDGNDDWGWADKTDSFPTQKSNNYDSSINTNSKVMDDWNASPGDDWSSWAEPGTQRNGSNDWGTFPASESSYISIDKIKGENRKQKFYL